MVLAGTANLRALSRDGALLLNLLSAKRQSFHTRSDLALENLCLSDSNGVFLRRRTLSRRAATPTDVPPRGSTRRI